MPPSTAPITRAAPAASARARRGAALLVVGGAALLVLTVVSVGSGPTPVSAGQVLAILADRVGITLPWAFAPQEAAIVLIVRLPRVLLGLLVGAGLAVSGATMQGLFRNPLADPGLVGVSSGAALAAVAVIVLGETLLQPYAAALGTYALPVAAFAGGLVAMALAFRIATVRGATDVASLLLAGIALNAIAGAGVGLLTYLATDDELRALTFWSLGSLGRATWHAVGPVTPLLAVSALLLFTAGRELNALVLGEAEAGHLGVNVQWVKRKLVILVAVTVGAAVSVSGIIGFVGLVAPHLVRLVAGPDHRFVVPGSLLLGACLMLGADLVARLAVAPSELPIGIVAAALGGPFFLALLLSKRRAGGF